MTLRMYVYKFLQHFVTQLVWSRALSLVATKDSVARDMFYNGDVKDEPGAVVCRVSPSWVRFGTFQLPISRGATEAPLSRKLADYVIKHHFPEFEAAADKYVQLLKEVVDRSAALVAKWQEVGFVHGTAFLHETRIRTSASFASSGPSGNADSHTSKFVYSCRLLIILTYAWCRCLEYGQYERAGPYS
jgi:hypothetical protein